MKVDHQDYRALLEVTVVERFFGFVSGLVKKNGTWGLQGCVDRGSTSGSQLGPGADCTVEAVAY